MAEAILLVRCAVEIIAKDAAELLGSLSLISHFCSSSYVLRLFYIYGNLFTPSLPVPYCNLCLALAHSCSA